MISSLTSFILTSENPLDCSFIFCFILSFLVYQYHNICRNSSSLSDRLCFFDHQYLCFCEFNNYRAECFGYDHELDQCNWCFSNGKCIQGDSQKDNDFVCICPKCYYGPRCQYSSAHFSSTLEQLFTHGLLSTTASLKQLAFYCTVIPACVFFIIGAFNNLFTFVTFYRSKLLRTGVGNYLLIGSVVNQLTLFFLAVRLIHIVLSTIGPMATVNITINQILCKTVAFALTSSGQLSYWLMSTVAIERLYVTWYVKGTWLKKPYVARWIMFTLTIIILLINAPQLAFYNSVVDTKTAAKSAICVLIYSHPFWMHLNQVNNYVNALLPLLINIICTSGIMFLIARQKLLANQNFSE